MILVWLLACMALSIHARKTYNFNGDWLLFVGDVAEAKDAAFDDSRWLGVTLPYAFNGDEAFRKDIVDLTDTIVWYRKHFTPEDFPSHPKQGTSAAEKYFIEFEGARQGADVYLNGELILSVKGYNTNWTPFPVPAEKFAAAVKEGDNVIAVKVIQTVGGQFIDLGLSVDVAK